MVCVFLVIFVRFLMDLRKNHIYKFSKCKESMYNIFGYKSKELIISYLARNPNKTIKEISEGINKFSKQIEYKNLHKILSSLVEEKIIDKKNSLYYLTSEFIEYMKNFSDIMLHNYTDEMFVRNKTDMYNVMNYLDPDGEVKSKVSDYLNTWLMEKLDDWYSKFYDPENIEYKKIKESISNRFNGKNDLNILEVGCGTGRVTERLSKDYSSVTAIDTNERYINYSKKKIKTVRFECSDIKDFKSKEKYDVIIFSWVGLHYQSNVKEILDNVKRLNEEGSLVLILDAYYETEFIEVLQMLRPINMKEVKVMKDKLNDELISTFGNLKNEVILNYYEFDNVESLIDNFKIELTLEESRVWTKEDEQKIKEYLIGKSSEDKLKIGEGFWLSVIEL